MKPFTYSLIIIGVVLSFPLLANPKIDSLRQLLQKNIADETRLNVLRELTHTIGRTKAENFQYLEQAVLLAEQLNRPDIQANTLLDLVMYYQYRQQFENAKKYCQQALELAQKHQLAEQLPGSYLNMGHALWRQSKNDSALLSYQSAIKAYEDIGETYLIWKPYSGTARIYSELKNYSQAEFYLRKAYAIVKDSDKRADKGSVLYFLAELYKNDKDFDKYYDILQEWEKFQKANKKGVPALEDRGHLSMLTIFAQEDDQLIEKFEEAVKFYKDSGNGFRLGWSYYDLGQALIMRNNYEAAKNSFLLALEQFRAVDYKDRIAQTYQSLYETEKQLDHPALALTYLEQHEALQDTLNLEKMKAQLAELEIAFQTEKKEQMLAMQELEIQQKTTQRNLFIGSSSLLAVIALLIFFGLRNRLRLNKKIARQEAELQNQKIRQLEQEKHLMAFSSMLEGQEKERIRIAKDLHDSLGGLLSTVKAHFNALKPKDLKPKSDEIYSKANRLIDEANVEVRRISHNMVPKALAVSGLKGALEDLVENLEAHGIDANLEIINLETEPDASRSLVLFRAIQEITNNIIKHAGAENVLIQLIDKDDQLRIFIEDDGKGFSVSEALKKGGMGLQNIESRVQFLNGTIDWDAIPGEGTTISMTIPSAYQQQQTFAA